MQVQTESGLNPSNENKVSPLARIFQLGREKSYITYEDILTYIPEPEKDLDLVDRVFAILLCAEIPYGEDVEHLFEDEDDPQIYSSGKE